MWWWISKPQIRWEHSVKIAPATCPNVVVDFYRTDKMGTQCQNSTSHLSKCGGGFLSHRFSGNTGSKKHQPSVQMWWWISTAQIRWEHSVKIAPATCPNVVVDFYRTDKMGTQCKNSTSHLSKCGGGFLSHRFSGNTGSKKHQPPVQRWWWISTAQIRWEHSVKIAPATSPNVVVDFYRRDKMGIQCQNSTSPNVVVDFYHTDVVGTQCKNSTSHLSKCGGGFLPQG